MKLTPKDAGRMVNWVLDGEEQKPTKLMYDAYDTCPYYVELEKKHIRRHFRSNGKHWSEPRKTYIVSFVDEVQP